MADFTQIIQEINDDINTNGVGAITGAKLNEVLRDMIAAVNVAKTDILPDGALYGGFAWPDEPPTYGDDHRYFYIAYLAGSYPAFDTELAGNILAIFYWLEDLQEWTSNNLTMTPTGIEELLSPKMDTVELYTRLGFLRFSPYSTYSVGDYVVNEGILYKFTSNHAAGQWDDNDVVEVTLLDYITDYVAKQLSGKQDTISDLATIRSGAAAGATAYQKPSGGIPKTDLASGVQTSLGKADTAFQKPSGGIPESDLSSDVQQALQKHFKGWYVSSSALPANPVVGDYAYVKGATSTDPAAIYECTTNGTWSDSGRTADTSNVQTFASGEEVNEVGIDDEPTANSEYLVKSGGVKLVDKILFDENHLGHWHGGIGTIPYIIANSANNNRYIQLYVDEESLKVGDIITFNGRSAGTGYYAFITIGENGRVLHHLEAASNGVHTYTVQSGDVWIYISTAYNPLGGNTYVYVNNAARVISETKNKQLYESVPNKPFYINNLFVNDNFAVESSTSGLADGLDSRTNVIYTLQNGIQTAQRNSQSTSGSVFSVTLTKNRPSHKCYIAFFCIPKGTLAVAWFGNTKTLYSGSALNDFIFISAMYDGASTGPNPRFEQYSFSEFSYKNLYIVDLTERFGEGNEPSKEEMDDLILNYENGFIRTNSNVENPENVFKLSNRMNIELGVSNNVQAITRDSDGNISSITETVNGKTITTTITRTNGRVSSIETTTPYYLKQEIITYQNNEISTIETQIKY